MSLCISITREMCLSLIISVWMVQSPNILRILQCSSAPTLKCFHWFCSPDNNNICFRMVLNPKHSEDSLMPYCELFSMPDNICFRMVLSPKHSEDSSMLLMSQISGPDVFLVSQWDGVLTSLPKSLVTVTLTV